MIQINTIETVTVKTQAMGRSLLTARSWYAALCLYYWNLDGISAVWTIQKFYQLWAIADVYLSGWEKLTQCYWPLPGARFDDGAGGDNEVQRTMLELINQLDGFDPRGNIKVLMATNRPDTLDPALVRPGRLDRKVEFGLPDLEVSYIYLL